MQTDRRIGAIAVVANGGRWACVLCLLGLALAGCQNLNDCKLYNTCAGDLIALAKEMASKAGEEAARRCEQCLRESCEAQDASCSVDVACNYTARTRLASSPSEYQERLSLLRERGYTRGTETRRPWEGDENEFGDCLHARCKDDCDGGRFLCNDSSREYTNIQIWLAVRIYGVPASETGLPTFELGREVEVRACDDNGEEACGGDWVKTGQDGIVEIKGLRPGVTAETLYFEIRPTPAQKGRLPPTFYYPQRLGISGVQLVPIYLPTIDLIAKGNALLGRPRQLLTDRAQSLVLPDSCIWEESSVPNVQIFVENEEVPQCHEAAASCSESCKPCVWYAADKTPKRTQMKTDGSGAGIVGLAEGGTRSASRTHPATSCRAARCACATGR